MSYAFTNAMYSMSRFKATTMPGVAVVLKSSLLLLLLPKADVVHADISCQGVGELPQASKQVLHGPINVYHST